MVLLLACASRSTASFNSATSCRSCATSSSVAGSETGALWVSGPRSLCARIAGQGARRLIPSNGISTVGQRICIHIFSDERLGRGITQVQNKTNDISCDLIAEQTLIFD